MEKLRAAMAQSSTLTTRPKHTKPRQRVRRASLSQSKIEKMLSAALNCDLSPTSITAHADGSITMSFVEEAEPSPPQKYVPKGWDI